MYLTITCTCIVCAYGLLKYMCSFVHLQVGATFAQTNVSLFCVNIEVSETDDMHLCMNKYFYMAL